MNKENQNSEFSNYSNNGKKCTFSYIGCMFKHEVKTLLYANTMTNKYN